MVKLGELHCPSCGAPMVERTTISESTRATNYDDCLRQCARCEVGASNAVSPGSVTFIYRDSAKNIPSEIAVGFKQCVDNALNVRSQPTKWVRCGFSTSEDAVTWVIFVHLLRSRLLVPALERCGLVPEAASVSEPSLLLWGSPVDDGPRATKLRGRLVELCDAIGEDRQSRSEPDVIVNLGNAGLIFVEVKYRSSNDTKPSDYPGWLRYFGESGVFRNESEVRASGCYELARNWRLLKGLTTDRPATLVNLGFNRLFAGAEGQRVQRFVEALETSPSKRFIKLTWAQLVQAVPDSPEWFARFVEGRHLKALHLPEV